jgi:hypothetical protein
LPAAGGVSGTINIGGVAAASTTCLNVTLATGTDASGTGTTPASALVRRRRALASTPTLPQPLVDVSLTNTYTGDLHEFFMTIQLPPGSVPAGQYPATISTTVELGDGQSQTTFQLFTVNVSESGKTVVTGTSFAGGGGGALAILGADTTGTLAIYPMGTVLPTPQPYETEGPTPTPTPIPSIAPTATPTATAAPSPTPTLPFATSPPGMNAYGNPPPADGSTIGDYSIEDPNDGGTCQAGQEPCDASNVPIEQQAGNGTLEIPTGFSGSITFSVDIGYMDIQTITNTCASDWSVNANNGGSGTITIPVNDAYGSSQTQPECTITFSTQPSGPQNPNYTEYYTEELSLQGVSGVPCSNGVCTSTAISRRRAIK